MVTGYLVMIAWYATTTGSRSCARREDFAESLTDADINASVIRNFQQILKRFPTPAELKESREKVRNMVVDNAGMLTDVVSDYVRQKFEKKASAPASFPSSSAPPPKKKEFADPQPSDPVVKNPSIFPFSVPESHDPNKISKLLSTIQKLTDRVEELEKAGIATPPASQPTPPSIDQVMAELDKLDQKINNLTTASSPPPKKN